MEIRPATQKDYLFCHNLAKENMSSYLEKHWDGWNSDVFKKNFDVKGTKIILKNKIRVGYFAAKLRQSCYYLDDIQLSIQGKGIGTQIMNSIEKEASKSRNKIQLTVFKDNPAKKLFEKLGYKILNDREHSLSMGKIIK